MSLVTFPRQFLVDLNGTPRVGAKANFYLPGSSTPITVYTTSAYTTPHSNPVLSVSSGLFPAIYVNPAVNPTYKVVITDSNDVTVATDDNVPALGFTASDLGELLYPQTDEEEVAVVTPLDLTVPSHEAVGVVIPQRYFPVASPSTAQMFQALTDAWDVALESGCSIYAPAGTYDVGVENLPFRQQGVLPTPLLDCQNITVFGDGPATIFKTSSVDGADVFQLNGLKNFHIRNLAITSTVSGSTSGSNGISVTAGWDNITIDGVHCLNLASLDATDHVDGGKALTLQPSTTVNECGTLKARIYAKGCAEGFGIEVDLNNADDKKTAVDVDLVAEDCFYAVKIAAGAATGALSASYHQGVRVRGQAINCQKDVVLNRAHGCIVDIQVVTTKSEADRRLSPSGVTWYAADTVVESLLCTYAQRAFIRVSGNKGACAYKARIGGTTAGSSGLSGATEDCDIQLDIGGTAGTADVLEIDSGGNTLRFSRLQVSTRTATSLPTAYYADALKNWLLVGYKERGSYTGALTGCTTAPTAMIEYSVEGDIVTLELPALTATSNTTACTITVMPAAIRPVSAQTVFGVTTDNGSAGWSRITVGTDGVLTLGFGLASNTFTNSGTKGLQPGTVIYRRV